MVTVTSDTSLAANFAIAANAPVGQDSVTVTTDRARVRRSPLRDPSSPTLTSVTSHHGVIGTTVAVTLGAPTSSWVRRRWR